MNRILILVTALAIAACTQANTPGSETAPTDSKAQGAGPAASAPAAGAAVTEFPTPATTPILSILVGNTITPAAKASWCLKDGTAPFTKIVIQDESIAAPIENQSAPLSGKSAGKDTATRQAPGTAQVTSQDGDSTFQIQWLSKGIKGSAKIVVLGDALSYTDTDGGATFSHCPQ